MSETPRSAKRRRLDRNSSTTAASSPAPISERKSSRKSLAEDIDIYDDFDGALNGGTTGKKRGEETTYARKSTRKGKSNGTNKSSREQGADHGTSRKSLFSSVTNGESHDERRATGNAMPETSLDGDVQTEDELVVEQDGNVAVEVEMQLLGEAATAVTPSKRKRGGRIVVQANPENEVMADEEMDGTLNATIRRRQSKRSAEMEASHEEQEEDPQVTPRRGRPPKKKRKRRVAELDNDPPEHDKASDDNVEDSLFASVTKSAAQIVRGATQVVKNAAGRAKNAIQANQSASTEVSSPELALLKSIVLAKLANRRSISLTNLTSEYTKVHTLLSATIESGESNSMLIIGARGSGKTTLINQALKDLSQSSKEHFHVVRLNGFVQTDDKLALREIWRQLGREMEIDSEESGPGKSYADTLAMLLALLSHPDEIAGKPVDQVAKSVVFIMDEFDLFATHPRQTLLYNLLDIAQSRKAPIAVLGLTTRIDVTEALEKRVRSRFSHRYVHLGLPRGLGQFVELGKAACMVAQEELGFAEKTVLTSGTEDKEKNVDWLKDWNDAVHVLFTDTSFLKHYVLPIYHTTKSLPTLCSSLLIPTSTLTTFPSTLHYTNSISQRTLLQPPDSNLSLLPTLSDLSLSLLIAAARLTIIHDTESLNFALAYAEYVSLASKARINSAAAGQLATGSGTRLFGKEVARKEWEGLVQLGLIMPVGAGAFGLGTGSRGGKEGEMFRVDVALEEVPGAVAMGGEGLSKVMDRWCRQI